MVIRRKTFLIGLFLSILFTAALFMYDNLNITAFEIFELKTIDIRYKIRGINKKEKDVVIVGIDEKSLVEIGRWPWKRTVHAELIKKLSELGAKSIGFDVSFTEATVSKEITDLRNSLLQRYREKKVSKEVALELAKKINNLGLSDDKKFAEAIKEAGNVSIGTYIVQAGESNIKKEVLQNQYYTRNRYVNFDESGLLSEVIEKTRTGKNRFEPYSEFKIIPPISVIGKESYGVGPYDIAYPSADAVYRDIPMVTHEKFSDMLFPPLYFLVYLSAMGLNMYDNVLLDQKDMRVEVFKREGNKIENLLSIPMDRKGVYILNYYGPGGTFDYVSYIDVLNGEVQEGEIKDKIVMVGYTDTAKGLYDLRPTPFDPNIAGVEIHATAIQNLIDENFFVRWETWSHLLILMFYCMIITLIVSNRKLGFISGNIFVLITVASYIVFVQVMFNNSIWVNLFYPIFSFFIIYLSLTIINYFDEGIEKSRIKNAFGHYLSPNLVEVLADNPQMLKLGGEKKELTVLFSDIQGFTSISEKMTPEALVEFLNRYLSVMTNIILDSRGMVDKYEGDAIMAVFGAPVHYDDHALMCCLAALEYQKKLDVLREKWIEEGLPPIYARIGINTGNMVVGNMGSEKRFDYTVMGDEVNLASRLEGANKKYGTFIMISQNTYLQVKEEIVVRELDIIRVKGKQKPVEVYELICKKGEETDRIKLLLKYYYKGLISYRAAMWDEAIAGFSKLLLEFPEDGPAKEYYERCIYFRDNPPEKDWDGVFVMKTK